MNLNGIIRLANYLSEGNITSAISEGLLPDYSTLLDDLNKHNSEYRQFTSQEKLFLLYQAINSHDSQKSIIGEWTAKMFDEERMLHTEKFAFSPGKVEYKNVNFRPGYFLVSGKKNIGNYWQTLVTRSSKTGIINK